MPDWLPPRSVASLGIRCSTSSCSLSAAWSAGDAGTQTLSDGLVLESVLCDLAQAEASMSHIDYGLRLLFGNPQEVGYRLQSFVSIASHGNCLHHLITPLGRGHVGVHDREP